MSSKFKFTVFPFLLFLACLILLGLLYLQHRLPLYALFFNADVLSYPMSIKGVLLGSFPYHGWYSSTGVHLFPNKLLVLFSLLVTGWHTYYANLVAMMIQLLSFYLVLNYFFRTFHAEKYAHWFTATLLIVLITHNVVSPRILIAIINYGYHAFIFIFALLSLILFCKELDTTSLSRFRLTIVFIISILCISSDSMYVAWFTIPVILTSVCLWATGFLQRKKLLLWLGCFVLSVPVGLVLKKIIESSPSTQPISFRISAILSNLHAFIKMFAHLDIFGAILAAITGIFCVILLAYCAFAVVYKKAYLIKKLDRRLALLIGFTGFLIITLVAETLLMTPIFPMPRYYLSIFIMSLSSVLIFTGLKFKGRKIIPSTVVLLSLLCVLFLTVKVFFPWTNLKTKYNMPSSYTCIYKVIKKYHLKNGISGYWNAKPLMFFSNDVGISNLNVAPYISGLKQFHWLAFKEYFKPSYTFAIAPENKTPASFTAKEVIKLNGQPEHEIKCGPYNVMIYKRNQLTTTQQ